MNNTLKSALLGTASMALMMAAAARPADAQTAFDGFYAGAQVGFHSFGTKERENLFGLLEPDSNNNDAFDWLFGFSDGSKKGSLSGITGGIFAGYGKTFSRFYVGGELDGGYSGAKGKSSKSLTLVEGCGNNVSGATNTTSVRAKESFGASVRLGYLISDGAMLYTRFGYQRTRFGVKSSLSQDGDTISLIDQSKGFNGFRFGMGAEVTLASLFGPTVNMGNSFVRVDWSHTWYQSKTFSGSGSGTFGSRGLSGTQEIVIKPTENKFMFGVGVRF